MAPSKRARQIVQLWPSLTLDDLVWLRRQLGGFGEPPAGVRERRRPIRPIRPIRPLDARGIQLDAEQGKADTRP